MAENKEDSGRQKIGEYVPIRGIGMRVIEVIVTQKRLSWRQRIRKKAAER